MHGSIDLAAGKRTLRDTTSTTTERNTHKATELPCHVENRYGQCINRTSELLHLSKGLKGRRLVKPRSADACWWTLSVNEPASTENYNKSIVCRSSGAPVYDNLMINYNSFSVPISIPHIRKSIRVIISATNRPFL